MKLSGLFVKLRKNNKKEYLQFQFCMTLSILLITSYLVMYGSDLVQKTLPNGGDSRKVADMIFVLAAVGCVMFSIYAASLFLRYKSRETGIFLALGAGKSKLARALFTEIGKMMALCSAAGVLLGILLAAIVGILFEKVASSGNNNHFSISVMGVAGGMIYSLILILCVAFMCVRFMKRSNVMDIINEQRKQEPLKKSVSFFYLISGIVMILVGVIIGYFLPIITVKVSGHWLGGWTNLFYILAAVGLYRILVYSIASHRKGKNPQKYYDNMISYGMLKFQGGSVVRNMLVISLLLMGVLLGIFYLPLQGGNGFEDAEDDISYRYPVDVDELSEEDVLSMADKYQISVKDYRETEFIQVLGDGVSREDMDENNNLIEEYKEKYFYYECISAAQFEAVTGIKTEIAEGHYKEIQMGTARENIYNKFGDMTRLYLQNEEDYIPMEFDGLETYHSLVRGVGFDSEARYIINDADYEKLKAGVRDDKIMRQVLFDIEDSDQSYAFCEELYEQFCSRASESMNYIAAYNGYQAKVLGEDYGYNMQGIYDGKRPALEPDWLYRPIVLPLERENAAMRRAIFLLLFVYIAVICLASESIILYTRSQNVALKNSQIFKDLEKLGANKKYLRRLLKSQIGKCFILPTVMGCLLMFIYEILIMWQNDGIMTAGEWGITGVMVMVIAVIGIYQFILYKVSMKNAEGVLDISR